MSPTSASYWGIPGYAIFWLLFAIALGLFAQRIVLLIRLILLGQKENRFDNMVYRIAYMLSATLSQWCSFKSVTRKNLAGIEHAFMFWGFCLFAVGYFVFIGLGAGFDLSLGSTFEMVYSSILDVAALLIVAAVLWAAARRYVIKPERLKGEMTAEASVILLLVFSLMVLHFFVEGLGNATYKTSASWPTAGAVLAGVLVDAGISQGALAAGIQGRLVASLRLNP